MFAWQATVQDEQGVIVVNPSVTVYLPDGETLAILYGEDGSPLSNPFIGTPEGFVQFWAQAGGYKVEGIDGAEQTYTWEIVLGGECLGNNRVYSIGPTGDFQSINDFISFGAAYLPIPNKNYAPTSQSVWRGQPVITGIIQSTFTMSEQVFLDGGDYSHIEIWGPSGINAAQNISITVARSAITRRAPGSGEIFHPVFYFSNCIAPRIRARFNVDTSSESTTVRGVHATNARAFLGNGGITDCPERGFCGYDGEYDISSSVWDRAGTIGVRLANRVSALLTSVSAQNCGGAAGTGDSGERAGLHARGGTTINMHNANFSNTTGEGVILVGCLVYTEGLVVTGCTTNNLRSSASTLFLPGANLSNAGRAGLAVRGCTVEAEGAQLNDCALAGLEAGRGAQVVFYLGSAQRCGRGITVDNASVVDAQQANLDDCITNAASCTNGSTLSLRSATGRRCGGRPLTVGGASQVNASSFNASARLVLANGIEVRASQLNLSQASIRGSGGVDDAADLTYWDGSQVNMSGATGGFTGSTANAINGSRGIVWKA